MAVLSLVYDHGSVSIMRNMEGAKNQHIHFNSETQSEIRDKKSTARFQSGKKNEDTICFAPSFYSKKYIYICLFTCVSPKIRLGLISIFDPKRPLGLIFRESLIFQHKAQTDREPPRCAHRRWRARGG